MEEMNEKKPVLQRNKLSKSTGKNMKVRIISSLVLLCICLPAVFVGSYYFFAFFTATAIALPAKPINPINTTCGMSSTSS